MRILTTIKNFSFWGVLFLAFLIFVFNVNLSDIVYEGIYGDKPLKYYCLYMLISVLVYLIFQFLHFKLLKVSIFDYFAICTLSTFWIPYRGITILFSHGKKSREVGNIILSLIETILWWFIILTGIYTIINTNDNRIFFNINIMEKNIVMKKIGVMFGLILVGNIIGFIAYEISGKKWKDS